MPEGGLQVLESAIVSQDKNKPVFDEQTLARLLEAAYILQEHGHELRKLEHDSAVKRTPPMPAHDTFPAQAPAKKVNLPELRLEEFDASVPLQNAALQPQNEDYSSTLARVVETQHEIEVRHLKGDDALALIANQLIEICGAAGAAIGLVGGQTVRYRAVAGIRTLPLGSEVPLDKALCAPCLRTGEVFTCPDAGPQSRNDRGEYQRRGIGALIIVPVCRESDVVGALELYYSDPRAFSEQDVNTCQLMAGLVGETIAQDAAAPQIPPMIEWPEALLAQEKSGASPRDFKEDENTRVKSDSTVCQSCGHELHGGEQFCGECGEPRRKESAPLSGPAKSVPLWLLKASKRDSLTRSTPGEFSSQAPQDGVEREPAFSASTVSSVSEAAAQPESLISMKASRIVPEQTVLAEEPETTEEGAEKPAVITSDAVMAEPNPTPDWSSALSARTFLEQIANGNRKGTLLHFWNARRGDIYLAIAVILVIGVIRWSISSNRPVKATATPTPAAAVAPHKPAAPELSPFDRLLISLGLAEPPEPPQDKGNPATQVWVDLRTGLYYCPATDLYGKTPKGKYTSQRDAQLDQFQPAYRKACE